MSDHLTLEAVDVDGAVQETAEAAGFGRGDFFRRGAIAGGGLMAGSALLGYLPSLASAAKPSAKNDVKILNYALTLEYLEAAFYKQALAKAGLRGPAAGFAKQIAPIEQAHVEGLKKALGAKAVKSPTFDFGDAVTSQAKFLATAHTLENAGVQAYLGQAGSIKNPAYLGVAASILCVEARHAGAVAELLNKPISPSGSYEVGATMGQILKAVKGTGFITG
jgi:hypothetical protein